MANWPECVNTMLHLCSGQRSTAIIRLSADTHRLCVLIGRPLSSFFLQMIFFHEAVLWKFKMSPWFPQYALHTLYVYLTMHAHFAPLNNSHDKHSHTWCAPTKVVYKIYDIVSTFAGPQQHTHTHGLENRSANPGRRQPRRWRWRRKVMVFIVLAVPCHACTCVTSMFSFAKSTHPKPENMSVKSTHIFRVWSEHEWTTFSGAHGCKQHGSPIKFSNGWMTGLFNVTDFCCFSACMVLFTTTKTL